MKKEKLMAAAVEYDPVRDKAPRLTAKGRGLIAEKIIEIAKKHDIPIKSDTGLVQILCRLDIDEQIPVELYRAVAEILAFIYRLNQQRHSDDVSQ